MVSPSTDPDLLISRLREVQSQIADHAMGLAKKLAIKTRKKYPWICPDDMQQNLMLRLDKWVAEYQPDHGSQTTWSKFLYHKMAFYTKDLLRKEDPLGIAWPQRKKYPDWFRLGDQSGVMTNQFAAPDLHSNDPEDDQFVRDYLAVQNFFRSLPRIPNQIPVIVDGDSLRHARCLWWDNRRHRIRFRRRKSDTLAHWIAVRRDQTSSIKNSRTTRRRRYHARQMSLCLD